MSKLSIIIPSYNCKYVSKTVADIFEKAVGNIEVIVVLDNYWPVPLIANQKHLIIVHRSKQCGMRNGINTGVSIATGDYILKCDDHCMFSKGFDKELIKESQSNQVSIPSRYSLDIEKWQTKWCAVEYEYMAYPYVPNDNPQRRGIGLYAKKWYGDNGFAANMGDEEFYKKERKLQHIKIDEIMIFHGSCWFMSKQHFINIGGLDENLFNTLYQEPQELSFKTWLSGGRVVVNKNCWYAHMYKGKDFGGEPNIRGYKLDVVAMRQTEQFGTWWWMNNQWPGAIRPMKWLIEKFWPIPGWPENWEEEKIKWEKKYPH